MQIGMIGLGKMGLNLVLNMQRNNNEVIGFDLNDQARKNANDKGVKTVDDLSEMIQSLSKPRVLWVMLPAGAPTNNTLDSLAEVLEPNDIVIDGGNSFYQDSIDSGKTLSQKHIEFFDCGTSGGMEGALNGGNFMIGGSKEAFKTIEPLFKDIAQPDGYLYTGPIGSGHYLKMVHNGIEYGMMEAIAEGFDVLEHSQFDYDDAAVAKVWEHGSVIRGWLMELAQDAFEEDPNLSKISGVMHSSGEGKWTIEEAIRLKVPVPVISESLMVRYRSLETDTYSGKVVSALRNGFGGHAMDPAKGGK